MSSVDLYVFHLCDSLPKQLQIWMIDVVRSETRSMDFEASPFVNGVA